MNNYQHQSFWVHIVLFEVCGTSVIRKLAVLMRTVAWQLQLLWIMTPEYVGVTKSCTSGPVVHALAVLTCARMAGALRCFCMDFFSVYFRHKHHTCSQANGPCW